MAERPVQVQESERGWTPPAPYTGMRIIDTSFPDDPWVVAQHEDGVRVIYIRRERDGRLWHHTPESWEYAWERDYLRHVAEETP